MIFCSVEKVQQKIYFLRRLRLFGVALRVIMMFYHACIESVLLYGKASWFRNLKVAFRSHMAMKMVGMDGGSFLLSSVYIYTFNI